MYLSRALGVNFNFACAHMVVLHLIQSWLSFANLQFGFFILSFPTRSGDLYLPGRAGARVLQRGRSAVPDVAALRWAEGPGGPGLDLRHPAMRPGAFLSLRRDRPGVGCQLSRWCGQVGVDARFFLLSLRFFSFTKDIEITQTTDQDFPLITRITILSSQIDPEAGEFGDGAGAVHHDHVSSRTSGRGRPLLRHRPAGPSQRDPLFGEGKWRFYWCIVLFLFRCLFQKHNGQFEL